MSFYQYVNVVLSNGSHQTVIKGFLACDEQGLTEKQMSDYLQEYHDVRDDLSSDGLDSGFFWTNSDTAAGVFPKVRRDFSESYADVYEASSPVINNIKSYAPELILSEL